MSTAYGSDVDNVGIYNSANVDLYHATGSTPTKFNVINYSNGQWTNNLDLSRDINVPILRHPIHLAFGAEHRYDNYNLGAGSPATYYGSGTQSLVGLRPGDAGNHSRDVYAGYVDLETKVTDKLDIDLAGRYESYTDAGSIETGKLSARTISRPGSQPVRRSATASGRLLSQKRTTRILLFHRATQLDRWR
ncbi:MAG: TonB-dependent receptor domain-containing protein [Janthinobacterium lividum]